MLRRGVPVSPLSRLAHSYIVPPFLAVRQVFDDKKQFASWFGEQLDKLGDMDDDVFAKGKAGR